MYELCSLPHGFKFEALTTQQARENFEVFVSRIAERVTMLEELVRSELPAWTADLSERSLSVLGEWFANHVEERPMTPEEREDFRKQMEPLGALADIHTEFTPLTLSLGVDTGIYLGECVRARCPATTWKLNRRTKQPVVSGLGLVNGDYFAIAQASLAVPVARARWKASIVGKPMNEPVTLAEKLAEIQLSIPDKDPRTMLIEILNLVQERPMRTW